MNDNKSTLNAFMTKVKPTQKLWALQDKESEDWVVLDSIAFENTEVMPLWSSIELAQEHCIEEWADYVPSEISLSDWFEFWIEDLNQDAVIIGVDWQGNDEYLEVELADFTQALSVIENLK